MLKHLLKLHQLLHVLKHNLEPHQLTLVAVAQQSKLIANKSELKGLKSAGILTETEYANKQSLIC